MRVAIFGTGYVGLVTGVCLAEIGHEITCIDINCEKIASLQGGKSPIYEPGLDSLLQRNMQAGRLKFTTDAQRGIVHSDLIFIAVGTPALPSGEADLQYVMAAAQTIAASMNGYALVVNKSTVPVGTGHKIQRLISEVLQQRGVDFGFDFASNPEFLKQGDAISDFMKADRIIVGAERKVVFERMQELYRPLDVPIIEMSVCSAELSKYAANAFLATKISFINEIARLAERVGADVGQVRDGIGSDSRINPYFLKAGCGYGGSCFPKDVKALSWMYRQHGLGDGLFDAVDNINSRQKQLLTDWLRGYFGRLSGLTIALWGLAFKPGTDDMREAPSRVVMETLWREGARVQAYDPVAMGEAKRIYGERAELRLCPSKEDALQGADALVVVTEWPDFVQPDWQLVKTKLRHPVVFDGRNLYDGRQLRDTGFDYFGVGRPCQQVKMR